MKKSVLTTTVIILVLIRNNLQTSCPDGQYFDDKSKTCISCGIKSCKTCLKSYKNSFPQCTNCEIETYLDLEQNKCLNCHKNCLICKEKLCIRCQRSFYPLGSSCLKCPEFCVSCVFPGKCLYCRPGFDRNEKTGKCESPSPFLTYLVRLVIFSFCVFLLFLCFFIPKCLKMRKNSKRNYLDRYMNRREEEENYDVDSNMVENEGLIF